MQPPGKRRLPDGYRQSLCQVLAKSVFMSFPRFDREERDMLQIHCSFGSKENTKCRFRLGHTRLQDQLVLLPFFRIDCQISGGKRLMFTHRFGIHQFNPQCFFFSVPLRQTCPNRETILLPFSTPIPKKPSLSSPVCLWACPGLERRT